MPAIAGPPPFPLEQVRNGIKRRHDLSLMPRGQRVQGPASMHTFGFGSCKVGAGVLWRCEQHPAQRNRAHEMLSRSKGCISSSPRTKQPLPHADVPSRPVLDKSYPGHQPSLYGCVSIHGAHSVCVVAHAMHTRGETPIG